MDNLPVGGINDNHMAADPKVLQTYPLDYYYSIIVDLLEPPTSEARPNGGDEALSLRPVRNFQVGFLHLSEDTFQYLAKKGALDLLPHGLRNQILRAYVKYVHPLLPILNMNHFLIEMIIEDDSHTSSPLLYQAVMLAGSAFIDAQDAKEAGNSSRNELRRMLFERAKLLFELETETDPYIQIQALLLMTQWHEGNMSHKNPQYWLNTACLIAERIGLDEGLESGHLTLNNRIWWSLYVQDRLLSLQFRSRLRIPDNAFRISLLKFANMAYEPCHPLATLILGDDASVVLVSQDIQKQMTKLFVEEINLAHHIGVLLTYLYDGSWAPSPSRDCKHSLAAKESLTSTMVYECEQALKGWIQGLPGDVGYNPSSGLLNSVVSLTDKSFLTHRAYLYLLYLGALCLLYQAGDSKSHLSYPGNSEKLRRVISLAKATFNDLHQTDLFQFLPGASVTILTLFLEAILPDLNETNSTLRLEAMWNLYTCEEAASQLIETHPVAEKLLLRSQIVRSEILGLVER
ncbi:hypothetical protein N7474_000584 [Penicillium riverlandense]|uniref:uncharacterized protein n=1 Tax=Penicillium riverlandense TaxID=1903569 RepID=UPI002549A936|nr:uncharacterized protein N7474_000584 [Penicillium riverlandense]KAJ5832273.1 hypothetical protein N7474_000584 [Penicillium riverlandense]